MILRYHWSHQMQQKVKVIKAHRKRERERERERNQKKERESILAENRQKNLPCFMLKRQSMEAQIRVIYNIRCKG